MPAKALVFVIAFVIAISFIVYFTESIIPLSVKAKMNNYCRNTLIQMEIKGGLNDENKQHLKDKLFDLGLKNIEINGTRNAVYGGSLELKVKADYSAKRLIGFFTRENETIHMEYIRSAIARKVTN